MHFGIYVSQTIFYSNFASSHFLIGFYKSLELWKKDEQGLGRSQRSKEVYNSQTRYLLGAFTTTKTEEKTEVKEAVVISVFVPNLLPENALEWQKVTHYC